MKNKIFILISLLAGSLLFNSCLKDKTGEDWTAALKGKMYAQVVNPGLQSSTINNGAAAQTVKIALNIATDSPPSSDVTVTVAFDAAALTAYNTANGKSFVLCPNISLKSANVVIPAGSRLGTVEVIVNSANLLSLTTAYVIPVSITGASAGVTVASNFKTTLVQVPVANPWEGQYTMNYYALRAGDPVLSGNVRGLNWILLTSGAKSVVYYKTHLWGDGKGTVGGIGPWTLTIDDTKNPMPVVVTDAANATVVNKPGYVSRYEPATKTFYIGVTWSTPGTRECIDTLKYSGPL
jgi:hypothetical protein